MILLLGGTSDSRELAAFLSAGGLQVLVTTVSEYGGSLAEESGLERVLTGALSGDKLAEVIDSNKIRVIVDATHPYAGQISKLAMEAAARSGISYCRFQRSATLPEGKKASNLHLVEDVEQAAKLAAQLGDNIFLAIGSKGLADFIHNLPDKPLKVTARVLPDPVVMQQCLDLGLKPRNIIAMQGPFSYELNLAMFRACGANVLVTKDSGREGGATAKFTAAEEMELQLVVISRPKITYQNQFSDFEGILNYIKA